LKVTNRRTGYVQDLRLKITNRRAGYVQVV
jgi:hypothetical protein